MIGQKRRTMCSMIEADTVACINPSLVFALIFVLCEALYDFAILLL